MKIGYYPEKNIRNNITYFLEAHSKKNPDQPVFYLMDKSITYKEFMDAASRIAAGYSDLGIKHGDRVILFVPMTINLYLAMSALQRIGAIPVFLDSWSRHMHLEAAVKQVEPKAIISFEKALNLMDSFSDLIPIKISVGSTSNKYNARLEDLMLNQSLSPILPVEREDTALITFTTGSSGTPKGADRSHRFLAAQHYALSECIPYKKNDIDLPIFPIFSLNNVASGITTVLPAIDISSPSVNDSQILFDQIKNTKINCATLSPSIFNNMANFCIQNNLEIPQLRRVITGGAPISRDDVSKFKLIAKNAEIVILYGSTEVEPISKITDQELLSSESVEDGVNVGHIVNGLRYMLIKIDKQPIKIKDINEWKSIEINDNVGELIVSGEHVCQKYYKNPDAFNRAKIVDIDGTIWHRTGDLIRIDKNNSIWIVGRVHNTIMRNEIYLFPVRAEVILKQLPFVHRAAYLGMPDSKLGEKAVAAIELKEKSQIKNAEELKSEITNTLIINKIPIDLVVFADNIPMDPRHHSKVEYNQLRKQIMGDT